MIGVFGSGLLNWSDSGDVLEDGDTIVNGSGKFKYFEYGNRFNVSNTEHIDGFMTIVSRGFSACDYQEEIKKFIDNVIQKKIIKPSVKGNSSIFISMMMDLNSSRSAEIGAGIEMGNSDPEMILWGTCKIFNLIKEDEICVKSWGNKARHFKCNIPIVGLPLSDEGKMIRVCSKFAIIDRKTNTRYGAGRGSICLARDIDENFKLIENQATHDVFKQTKHMISINE